MKFTILGVIQILLGALEVVLMSVYKLAVIPKLLKLYVSDMGLSMNNNVYRSINFVLIMGIVCIVFGVVNLILKERQGKFYNASLVYLILSFPIFVLLIGLIVIYSIGPLYSIGS